MRALRVAATLGISEADVNEAFGILGTVFGIEWLNAAAEDFSPSDAIAFRRHPIGDLVSTAGDDQLAELIELATCFRELARVPGIERMSAALRGPYRATFFQLRLAVMLQRAGALIEHLEPEGTGGRSADVAFSFEGTAFTVECYRASTPPSNEMQERIRLAQQVLETVKALDVVISVGILLREEPTPSVRREIVRVVRRLATEVARESAMTTDFPAVLVSGPAGVVSICRGLALPAGTPPRWLLAPRIPVSADRRPTIFMRFTEALASEMVGIDASFSEGTYRSHVALWLDSDRDEDTPASLDLGPPLQRLARKLERKLPQARTETGRLRVLAAETWLAREIEKVDVAGIGRFRGKLVDSHEGVAGVLLLQHRTLVPESTSAQVLAYIGPSSRLGLPDSLLTKLASQAAVRLVRPATS